MNLLFRLLLIGVFWICIIASMQQPVVERMMGQVRGTRPRTSLEVGMSVGCMLGLSLLILCCESDPPRRK